MQSKFTFKSFRSFSCMILLITAFFCGNLQAQTTISTPYARLAANQAITINFQNNNTFDVAITNITGGLNLISGTAANIAVYHKATPVNGLPGNIASSNGWILFGSAAVIGNGAGTNQSLVNTNLIIPAGATYGICISATPTSGGRGVILYSNVNIGRDTTTAGNCSIITGTNVGYAGLLSGPTVTPRYFAGAITFVKATPCSGNPSPGTTKSSVAGSCIGIPFTLSTSSPVVGGTSGITYQWQSSVTGVAGSYTNIPSATNDTYTLTQTVATYYQQVVTCANGGGVSISTPLFIGISNVCYCNASGASSEGGTITNVTFAGVNQSSIAAAGYENFLTDTASVIKGANYLISFTNTTPYTDARFHVWIDFNQNGSFEDPSESVFITPSSLLTYPVSGNISIPASAMTGNTRMRVRMDFYDTPTPNATSCGTSDFGQVEDYTVNINPCVPTVITNPAPSSVSVTCGGNTTIGFTAVGSFPVYQWQTRASSTSTWVNVSNNPTFSGSTTSALSITNADPTLNGNQFRVVYSGTCTSTDFSNVTTLSVNPIVAVVTPVNSVLCQGGIQQFSITNIASPIAGSVTTNSTYTTPIAIPDASGPRPYAPAIYAGINNTLAVSVPAGATVTGVSVRMSGTHTYFGDLVMTLKAPNNKIVNLDYFLSGTGGDVSTAFTNTVISSKGTAALSTGLPATFYTGTFKADFVDNPGLFANSPAGPTEFLPTGTSWTPLITPTTAANASGNWTLAIYDGGAGDAGTLANWSITVNYLLGSPATGVYKGPTGTIFTDAAATIPYSGTAINSVYVKPLTNGVNNYSVVVTDAACSSDPLAIPVIMYAPVSGTATLRDTTICENDNASFALGGTLTGGPLFNHQFQVKTTPTSAWVNVIDGGVYSGAKTNKLTLTTTPLTYNGYQYRDSISTGNSCGSLISTVAKLTVNALPVVAISAAPRVNLFPGLTTTLTAAVSGVTSPVTYQWFRNNVPVTGATTNKLVVGIDGVGTYTIKVTAANCSSTSATTTPSSITIGDSSGVTKLFIYPSPNNGKFQVRYFSDINNGSKNPAMLNVYDEKGTRVFSKFYGLSSGYQQMNVDLGSHSSGIYRVELSDLNGDRIKTGSVMVF